LGRKRVGKSLLIADAFTVPDYTWEQKKDVEGEKRKRKRKREALVSNCSTAKKGILGILVNLCTNTSFLPSCVVCHAGDRSTCVTVDFFFSHLFTLSLTCFPFFFCSCFTDYKNTFKTIYESDHTVALITNANVGVLLLKDWFEWADESKLLAASMRLIFHLHLEVTYKDKVNYCSVTIAGDVLVCDHLGNLVKVGYIDFECDESQGNPVVAYLQCHGLAKSAFYAPHY
jgi:hypothetical protein